ncbi:hypothetical protein [Saccharothrix syringae]|uniref:Uncharacterized protein n=1 Tax=Saccharothrix syringae TaxID=103733 RepID=A0A5Q0H2L0_SACSY|nr:hypothetical protein [Saccharothrix syringae]QFZ20114.1 hypothetical protein EKG83_24255 [Saccharothrix syringae]
MAEDARGTLCGMPTRRLEILLPADVTVREYAAVAHAVWAVLNAAGFGGDSSLRPDDGISDAELNAAFDQDVAGYPWAP